jgi:hypothetical protein
VAASKVYVALDGDRARGTRKVMDGASKGVAERIRGSHHEIEKAFERPAC